MKSRLVSMVLLLLAGVLIWQLADFRKPLDATLTPVFELVGKPISHADTVLSKALPIGDLDEKQMGEAIKKKFAQRKQRALRDERYVNNLIKYLVLFKVKPFAYRAFVIKSSAINAFALPGGVILVTSGLLRNLKNEAQLMAVLAHEMGHIERSHCFKAVKGQLLLKKVELETLGKFVDFSLALMFRHSFSKTQEAEADSYALKLLKRSRYHVGALAGSFRIMLSKSARGERQPDLLRDYFASHPPLKLRVARFEALARGFVKNNPGYRRYLGAKNLRRRKTFSQKNYQNEWFSAAGRAGN